MFASGSFIDFRAFEYIIVLIKQPYRMTSRCLSTGMNVAVQNMDTALHCLKKKRNGEKWRGREKKRSCFTEKPTVCGKQGRMSCAGRGELATGRVGELSTSRKRGLSPKMFYVPTLVLLLKEQNLWSFA